MMKLETIKNEKSIFPAAKRQYMPLKTRISRNVVFLGLLIFALMILYPLFWMFISSFKSYQEIYSNVWALPSEWHFENYKLAWEKGIQNYFVNSAYVTGFSIFLTVMTGTMAAFVLARYRNRWIDAALLFIIGGLMMNPEVALIPLFEILTFFNLIDTRWALILTYVAYRLPLTIILIRAFFITVPKELSESALIDGCSEFGIYWRIYLPLSIPIVITSVIINAFYAWNEFLFATVFINSSELKTIPSGLMVFRDALRTDWGVLLSGMVIASVPMVILLIVLQKYLVRGLSEGSVKG
ncbi:carbohydrate ABC transporter permease [Rossellomorea aquimaris]|jgi:raffinose/stachyose/melibiose transport system permease protein|uniref:Carbohydrate ABC transporter permease n=1 Tax=Rossellomorea aquimaris TaxID=189382 RepID=A0A5D4U3G2_9BACI|nr:carbohydrate ABC transporter permease [Rossellomorea aquimaris]TYS81798.1 carbohydrate ABC transporter permease [Rossellomorea aquimaris]TYS88422.1 carbohydrate ABC transporter permease [Rossellomorea aquimaris]